MGSRLFEATTPASPVVTGQSRREDAELSLQLVVAALVLLVEKRDSAIAGLQRAVLREQQRESPIVSRPASLYASAVGEDEGEEDDPADALAMNYIEDDVELTSESLESKGMRRKAAAAAYDAAALLKSLRKRTQSAKDSVKLYSVATLYALRTVRLFLREYPRLSFADVGKFSNALASLFSPSAYRSYAELLPNEDTRVFLSFELYREAVWVWGESIPLLFPDDNSLSVLRSLTEDCTLRDPEFRTTLQCIDNLSSPPCTDLEAKLHKLQVLCRRLRVGDMLDSLVSRPVPLVVQDDESPTLSSSLDSELALPASPKRMASLVTFISDSRLRVLAEARDDLERFCYSICHRYHTKVLLMDGMIENSMDSPTIAARTPKFLATGDSLKVAAQPGPALHFDAAKCADSMAIITDNGANGPSVNQRASKVWGSVLATHYFSPKSGVHRFAVRLDRCERGHVFVGVSTVQASVKTYVGGDKHGWGMIGTQALWHDRRKVSFGSSYNRSLLRVSPAHFINCRHIIDSR
jgi:hypothetical protein